MASLDAGYSDLAAALSLAEATLRAVGIKLYARVRLKSEDAQNGYEHLTLLVYDNPRGEWGLFIETGIDGESETWESRPLLNASRDLRVMAAERLLELWDDLLERVERERIRTVRAAAKALEFVAKIKAAKAGAR